MLWLSVVFLCPLLLQVFIYPCPCTIQFQLKFSVLVLSAFVHCPSWSTCFELELPQISCIFFQYELWLWFLNTLFPEICVACCTPHQWTDFAEKWPGKNEFFLCELSLIHCEATQGAVLAQLQSNVPCCGNRAGKVQEHLKPCQPSPTPHTQRAVQALPIPLFPSNSLAECCLSSDPSAPYIVYFPGSTFPFYHLSTLSGFLPRRNPLLWNSLADIHMQISADSLKVHYSNSLWSPLLC